MQFQVYFLLYFICAILSQTINLEPIIGILSQKPSNTALQELGENYTSYIAASYVKFVESPGGRVVPIIIIFPGGASAIDNSSGYGRAGQILYDKVLEKNSKGEYFPLFTICMGFEMITYLSGGHRNILTSCNASGKADPLYLEPEYTLSKLFENMPQEVFNTLTTEESTANFHKKCVTKENFTAAGLDADYYILSRNYDYNGMEYISTIEHRVLPIFGFQWHPEKNAYEWKYTTIPHSPSAVVSSQYIGNFMLNQARMNNQTFASYEEESSYLIYNYQPIYSESFSSFVQNYYFY